MSYKIETPVSRLNELVLGDLENLENCPDPSAAQMSVSAAIACFK
jgi:hypothetical protein